MDQPHCSALLTHPGPPRSLTQGLAGCVYSWFHFLPGLGVVITGNLKWSLGCFFKNTPSTDGLRK